MSSNKRRLLGKIFRVDLGCGCGKPKLSDIFEPRPRTKTSSYQNPTTCHSSSSSWERGGGLSIDDEAYTSTTFSLNINDTPTHYSEAENDPKSSKMVSPCPKIDESIAVEKDSNDPYLDFRHSMLQMILEKEIYSRNDLQELLNCFLQLNSPCHHDIIVQAFMEIWNGVISARPVSQKPFVRQESHEC